MNRLIFSLALTLITSGTIAQAKEGALPKKEENGKQEIASEKAWDLLVKKLDRNKDGKISDAEKADMPDGLRKLYDETMAKFDADKDGKLNDKERVAAKSALDAIRKEGERMRQEMMEKVESRQKETAAAIEADRKAAGAANTGLEAVRKKAEEGDAKAQVILGNMYLDGRGVEADGERAAQWFLKAAEQGNAEAQAALGGMYLFGMGVEKDVKQAFRWTSKAAERGDADSQCALGRMYALGIGVAKDKNKAIEWYRKAAEQGDEVAKDALRKLGK